MFLKTKNKKNEKSEKKNLKKELKIRGFFVFLKNILKINLKKIKSDKKGEFILKRKKDISVFHKADKNQIYLKQTLEDYFDFSSLNKKKLGKEYQIISFLSFSKEKIGKISKIIFKAGFKLSYRSLGVILIGILVYGISPYSLSAPQSLTITEKSDWELGTNSDIKTNGSVDSRNAIQLSPSGDWTARVWSPPEDIIGGGHSSVMADNDLFVMRGYSDKAFWKFDTQTSEWETMPDLPMPSYYGANMLYDQNGSIYMMFGGFSKKFYRYDIENQTYTELPELLDTPWVGASMTTDGSDIFILRGNTSTDFWKYDVSENSWGNLSATPGNVSTGGNLVNGQNGYLYLVRGGNTRYFDRYNLTTRAWETTPTDLPSAGCSGGACNMNGEQQGVYYNGYLYFLQSGGRTDFLRFNILANSWEILSSDAAPATVNYSSLSLNSNDNLIYAFRGNGTFDFWKFDASATAGQRWVGPQQVNNGVNGTVGTGGDLIWNEGSGASNYVYAIRGGNTANFYRYNVATNTWSSMANVSYGNVNYDLKGTWYNGNLYFPRFGSTTVYTFNGTAWGTMTDLLPAAVSNGSAMAYNSGDNRIYILRGGGTQTMYYQPTSGGAWQTASNIAVNDGGTTLNYFPNVGARMVSDDTNLYIMPGDGETAFLRYNTGSNTYSKLSATPFSQYYGVDMTYNDNGKIIALAGWYKDETWEYDIADDSWRRLPDNQKFTYGRGPYNGASIEFNGGNNFYATNGGLLADMWNFSAGATNYSSSGTYISQSIDLSQVESWISFTKNDDIPANTNIVYETRTGADNENWSSWEEVSGSDIQSEVNRYLQVRITLSSSDGLNTPTVYDYTVSYNSEDSAPSNPSSLTATSQQVGGLAINSGGTYSYDHPYFDWPAEDLTGGATDGSGSGIKGYYVYFGTNLSADPVTDGSYTTATYYSVNETLGTGTYYLRIKTEDNNGNLSDEVWEAFSYIYNGVSPAQNEEKTTQDDFDNGTFDNATATSVSDSVRLESKTGFWNQVRLSLSSSTIYSGGEMTVSSCAGSSNHCIYTLRGYNTNTFMRYEIETDTWVSSPTTIANAPATVYWGGSLVAGPDGYLYAFRGNNQSSFWRYDIANNLWETIDSVPKIVTYGSTLSYDGSRYIYATVGNDDAFYRYDTCNGQGSCTPGWSQRANADFGNPNTSDGQRVYEGADSVYDSAGNIFMMQGNYYAYFSKYSTSENEWIVMSPLPGGPYNGGSLVFDEDNNEIYALVGKGRLSMYKYNVDANSWTVAPDAPGTISYGADMAKYGSYIYVTRGGASNGFYRYDIEHNTWQLPQFGFFGPHYLGGSYFNYYYGTTLASGNNDKLYMARGYYDNTFGVYDTSEGSFTDLARLPIGAYQGASLVYNEDENAVYYNPGYIRTTRSAQGTYFFKYDVATDTWSEITTDHPPDETYTGSNMTYDGARYIYLTRGNNSQTWWSYDTQGVEGSRWSVMPITGGAYWTDGGKIVYKDGYIYATRGSGYPTSWRFDVGAGTWSTMGNFQINSVNANLGSGASLVNGGDGYLYVARGGNTNVYFRYNTSQALPGSWQVVSATIPAQVTTGGDASSVSHRNWQTTGAGTNTFADGLYSYVVGSENGATGFEESGTYETEAIDLLSVYHWANLTANYALPENTAITFETSTSSDGSEWSSWSAVSNIHTFGDTRVMNINSTPNRYIKVKILFSSSDQIFSPRLDDFTINYYQDIVAPQNPSSLSAYSDNTKATSITTNTWHNNQAPYFEWPAEGEAGGASDNSGGSGIFGYWVCFGTNADCVDPFVDGEFQETNNYTASGLVSGQDYYLKIKAVDNANMIPAENYSAFLYRFDNIAPNNPSDISVNPTGYASADTYTFTWEDDASDGNSGVAKFQYKTGEETDDWHDISDPLTVSQTANPYQANKNIFYLRTVDNAGNFSEPIFQEYYYSGGAASPPTNLIVDPSDESNASNSFTFTWDLPVSYAGDSSKLKYYYSINSAPTPYNVIETSARAAGPGPFATQYGKNTFYVVALNEGGNKNTPTDIDWDNPATVDFYAQTTAPGPPLNVQIFDTSDRENEEYSIAVKWSTPTSYDSGNFSGYVIYRSTDNSNFTEIASTTGTAYVDSELLSQAYYYYVKSKDKTNNYSISTSTVDIIPTGRYTSPPTIVSDPSAEVKSFSATIDWSTNRVASSFVEYGKSMDLGETNGQVDSLTAHSVEIKGLDASTKYYYRVKFIDPDGNIGISETLYFTTLPPPTISEVTVSDIGLNSAIISWKTNVSSTCTLKYGKGGYATTVEETSPGTTHLEKLTNLETASIYNYQVDAIDADLNTFNSDEYIFQTLEQTKVSDLTVQNKENVDIPTVNVNYKTSKPSTTLVKFKSSSEGEFHNYLVSDMSDNHEAVIEGLDPALEYTIIASGIDANGIEVASSEAKITTLTDSRPPTIITNRSVGKVIGRGKDVTANLYVKIETDEVTRVKVLFGKGSLLNNFDQSTPEDPFNTYHLITIPATPGQVYSYVIQAFDGANNETKSVVSTVVVEGTKENATEIVVNTFQDKFGWVSKLWTK